jgi:hypothetical protein
MFCVYFSRPFNGKKSGILNKLKWIKFSIKFSFKLQDLLWQSRRWWGGIERDREMERRRGSTIDREIETEVNLQCVLKGGGEVLTLEMFLKYRISVSDILSVYLIFKKVPN